MQQSEVAERRSFPRHDVEVAARYWTDDERAAVACNLLDVSLGGLCIDIPSWAWLEPGAYVTVELPVPGGLTVASTPARVTAVNLSAEGRKQARRVHLRFLDTSPVFRALLLAATDTWESRHLPRGN